MGQKDMLDLIQNKHNLKFVSKNSFKYLYHLNKKIKKYLLQVTLKFSCGRGDLNSHTLRYEYLKLARLPIPPRPHILNISSDKSNLKIFFELNYYFYNRLIFFKKINIDNEFKILIKNYLNDTN